MAMMTSWVSTPKPIQMLSSGTIATIGVAYSACTYRPSPASTPRYTPTHMPSTTPAARPIA